MKVLQNIKGDFVKELNGSHEAGKHFANTQLKPSIEQVKSTYHNIKNFLHHGKY